MSGSLYSPRFEVTVGGTTFQESGGRIADLVVETTLDGADRFSLALNYPFDREFGTFTGLDWDTFSVGTDVDISVGWGGGSLEPVFLGTIHAVRSDYSAESGPSVGVSGYGRLHDMMQGTASDSWSETTLGDVVNEVLSSYYDSGKIEVSGADLTRPKVIQHNQSDYRFVTELADTYGFEFAAHRDEVSFTPRASYGGDPTETLRFGEGLDSFSAEINESTAVGTVEVRDWNETDAAEVVGTATAEGDAEGTEVFRMPVRSQEEADEIAATKLSRLSDPRAAGHGEAEGHPTVVAGETVNLANLDSRFARNYYVTQASHRIGGSGYRTSFDAKEIPE